MSRVIAFCSFFLMSFSLNAQSVNAPVLHEKLGRGIYTSFEEFKFNRPAITDSFYVEVKPRKGKGWRGTEKTIPRFFGSNKKVKKVWGYSDGTAAFILFQGEFFELDLKQDKIKFIGYPYVDEEGAALAGVLGGAIGAGIYAVATSAKTNSQQVAYKIHPNSGRLYYDSSNWEKQEKEPQLSQLIIFRKEKKEASSTISLTVNDSIRYSFIPNSIVRLNFETSRKPIKICYDANKESCIELSIMHPKTTYIEVSQSEKEDSCSVSSVEEEIGEFYTKQVTYYQEKREKGK